MFAESLITSASNVNVFHMLSVSIGWSCPRIIPKKRFRGAHSKSAVQLLPSIPIALSSQSLSIYSYKKEEKYIKTIQSNNGTWWSAEDWLLLLTARISLILGVLCANLQKEQGIHFILKVDILIRHCQHFPKKKVEELNQNLDGVFCWVAKAEITAKHM